MVLIGIDTYPSLTTEDHQFFEEVSFPTPTVGWVHISGGLIKPIESVDDVEKKNLAKLSCVQRTCQKKLLKNRKK